MTPSSRKAKGRNLQNWVRDQIIKLFPELANDIKSTPMGVTEIGRASSRERV